MLKNKLCRATSALAAICISAAFIPALSYSFTVKAEKTDPTVLTNPGSRLLLTQLDIIEDDFNRPTVEWTLSKGAEAASETSFSTAPYAPFEGSRSLRVTCPDYASGEKVTLSRTALKNKNLSDAAYYVLAVYVPADRKNASVTLSITASSGSFEETKQIASGEWQVLFFNLNKNSKLNKAKSVTAAISASGDGSFEFLTDSIGAVTSENALYTMRYIASDYIAQGCTISGRDSMNISLRGNNQYIEAENPVITDFSGGMGLCVRLINSSNCRLLTLQYTTLSSSEYTEKNSITAEIPAGDGLVSCLFAIPDEYIGKFRIIFNESVYGSAEIESINPVSCCTFPQTAGGITDCTVNRELLAIGVRGYVNDSEAEKYSTSTLYLYELDLWEDVSGISPTRTAVAETMLTGSVFSFSIPLDSGHDRLFKKYAVMIYYNGGLIQVGYASSVTNPEILADGAASSAAAASMKGIYPLQGEYTLDGISYTAVEIRIDEILTLGQKGSITHTAGNISCSLNSDYVSALDQKMREYATKGVLVNFILRAAVSEDVSLNGVLIHPSAASGAGWCAFNTVSSEGINGLRAVCDFLAGRYSSSSGYTSNAVGYVVGSAISNAYENYNMGEAGIFAFTKAYTNAFRTVYNAVNSVSAGISVYIPLGGSWYRGLSPEEKYSYDGSSVLEAFSACISAGGNIGWKLSYDIYAGDESYYSWEDTNADKSREAKIITAANLEALVSVLSDTKMLYKGTERKIMILQTEKETVIDENRKIKLSADYIYTYLKLTTSAFFTVESLIPAHYVNYNNTLRYIDTSRFEEITAYAKELMNINSFNEVVPDYSISSVVGKNVIETQITTVIPSAVKGQWSFSGTGTGWGAAAHCISIKSDVVIGNKEDLLNVRFSSAAPTVYRGITNVFSSPLDLSAAPYIGFEVSAAGLPAGVKEISLITVFYSGKNYSVSYGTVKPGEWTTAVIDLGKFSGVSYCDRMDIYICSADGTDIGEPSLIIGNIRAMSTEFDDSQIDDHIKNPGRNKSSDTISIYTVAALGAVILLALVAELVRIFSARRAVEE